MDPSREEALSWERRWAVPAALAALAAIGFVIAAIVLAGQVVGGADGAEQLRNVDAHRTAQLVSIILQAIGVGLLAAPLYYLFRAARARSDTMRGQLVGLVIAAPLFLAALAIFSGISTLEAATDFVNEDLPGIESKGLPLDGDRAEDLAEDAVSDAPLRGLAVGFGLGGPIGFAIAMVYTCLHAMRTGLLTRFWGSLGMALGAVSFIFFQFTLLWFVYLGLLLLGWSPGGRPPAWDSGEAEPWPTPAERAAADLEGPPGQLEDPIAGPADDSPGGEGPRGPGGAGEPRRKRKQRD